MRLTYRTLTLAALTLPCVWSLKIERVGGTIIPARTTELDSSSRKLHVYRTLNTAIHIHEFCKYAVYKFLQATIMC